MAIQPAGVFRLTGDSWFEVLGSRPTNALWGTGADTACRLAALGIATVAELAAADPGRLAAEFGPAIGPWLIRIARGEDDSPVSGTPYLARSQGGASTDPEALERAAWHALDRFATRRPVRLPGVRAEFAEE